MRKKKKRGNTVRLNGEKEKKKKEGAFLVVSGCAAW